MTEIWFIRHGETDWNVAKRLQGWQDIALNDVGERQAQFLADRLQAEAAKTPFAAAYTSDLLRTAATMNPSAERLGLAAYPEKGLRERHYGVLEGLGVEELPTRAPPEAYAAWLNREEHGEVGGGETLRQFHDRIVGTVERIAAKHTGERVLVMTHGGALDIIYRHAQGYPLAEKRQRTPMLNVSINRVEVGPQAWRVLQWSDVAHIPVPVRNDVVAG